jgi:hypothetical protein
VIESVELVLAALAAGAAAGVGETASTAVRDAYAGLKAHVLKVLHGDVSVPATVVGAVEKDSVEVVERADWQREIVAALTAADAGSDAELVAAAQRLLELTDSAGSQSGKYQVLVCNNKGVQVGDHNAQTNTFN